MRAYIVTYVLSKGLRIPLCFMELSLVVADPVLLITLTGEFFTYDPIQYVKSRFW